MNALSKLDGVTLRHLRVTLPRSTPARVQLHVVEAGPPDGAPVLLLHGFPEYWYAWRKIIPTLARAGYRVLAPDQRGYAGSDAPKRITDYLVHHLIADVLGLMEALRTGPVHVVGHDWGGVVAWGVAAGHPDQVRSLTVTNCPHPLAFRQLLKSSPRQMLRSWYMALFQVPWLPERVLARGGLRREVARTAAPGAYTADDLDRYDAEVWSSAEALRGPIDWYRATARAGNRFPRDPVRPPTQLVWGTADHALGTELISPSLARADDHRLVEVPGCSHWVPNERPEALLEALLGLLTDTGGPDPAVYKIADADAWNAVDDAWEGSADDLRDGFIHLSSGHQVAGTLERHFAGRSGLVRLKVDIARLPRGALRWDVSRGGARFPHLYAPLPRAAIVEERPL